MLLISATPVVFRFANFVLPEQIGSPDVAFPRLNDLSYCRYLFGGSHHFVRFHHAGRAAAFGWTAYTPLSETTNSPIPDGDLWALGPTVAGPGTILRAVNVIITVVCLRSRILVHCHQHAALGHDAATALLLRDMANAGRHDPSDSERMQWRHGRRQVPGRTAQRTAAGGVLPAAGAEALSGAVLRADRR